MRTHCTDAAGGEEDYSGKQAAVRKGEIEQFRSGSLGRVDSQKNAFVFKMNKWSLT